jgi:hypothetical protein
MLKIYENSIFVVVFFFWAGGKTARCGPSLHVKYTSHEKQV